MWIRPGFEVYWRGPGESQIGLDPRCALVLDGLEAAEQRLLERMHRCFDLTEVRALGRDLGLTTARIDALMDRLRSAGYVLAGQVPAVHPQLQTGPDDGYWHRAALAGHPRGTQRSTATVRVRGLEPLGLRIGAALVHAGVGTVMVDDDTPVRRCDVGGGLYRSGDIGRSRQDCALSVLRGVNPKVRIHPPVPGPVDLVVIVQSGVADPVTYRDLVRQDVTHLPVLVRDLDVVVGPLVQPGTGPCLRCLDLHRSDQDPRWPTVATQAASRSAPGTETSLAWVGAALAAHQVLSLVDGRDTAVAGTSLEVTAWDPVPLRRSWSAHPECGCVPATLSGQAR